MSSLRLTLLALVPAAALAQAAPSPAATPAPAAQAAPSTPTAAPAPTSTPTPTAAPPPRLLGLAEATATARVHQPQLRQALAASAAAAARTAQARAPLLPQLDASAYYQRATGNVSTRPGSGVTGRGSSSWTTYDYFSGGLTLSQTLLDPVNLERWRAAGATAEATDASGRATAQLVAANARIAFFAARAARDRVQVARDTLANLEAHLRQVEAFVQVGTRPAIDLAQARSDRATAALQLTQAENGYDTAKAQLAQAMGVEDTSFEVSDDSLDPVPGEGSALGPLVEEAVAARPELAALQAQLRAQALTRSAAFAGYLPTVGAQTGLSDAGPDLHSDVWNWNAQLTLTWSLFDGGLTHARVSEADANLESLRAQEDALRIQVRLDVDSARLGVRAGLAELVSAADALQNARERLRLAEGRYQAGAGSIIELGDAQVAATSAAATEVQARFDLATARARLLLALGRG